MVMNYICLEEFIRGASHIHQHLSNQDAIK